MTPTNKPPISPERLQAMAQEYQDGATMRELAQSYDRSLNWVSLKLKKMGVQARRRGQCRWCGQ